MTEASRAEMPKAWADHCCITFPSPFFFFFFLTCTLPPAFSGERLAKRISGLWFCGVSVCVCDAMLWQPCFPSWSCGGFKAEYSSSGRKRCPPPPHTHPNIHTSPAKLFVGTFRVAVRAVEIAIHYLNLAIYLFLPFATRCHVRCLSQYARKRNINNTGEIYHRVNVGAHQLIVKNRLCSAR